MSASAHDGRGEDALPILVMQVGNPERRSIIPEFMAAAMNGVVVPAWRAGKACQRKPPNEYPKCPFVVHGPKAGIREVAAVLRAERRGWQPFVTCRDFRLHASYPAAYRVSVVPFVEPVFDRAKLAELKANPAERMVLIAWLLDGAQRAARNGFPVPTEQALRATAAAVH